MSRNVCGTAGWTVTRQPFDFQGFEVLSPSVLERVAPAPQGLWRTTS